MNNFQTASSVMDRLLDILPAFVKKEDNVNFKWGEIVSSVKRVGPNLAAHSRIIDIINNSLLIETDHPGYIQLFQINQKYILEGLKRNFPELEIRNLSFKLKNELENKEEINKKNISKKELEKIFEEREKKAEKEIGKYFDKMSQSEEKTQKKVELSPEINNIFDNMNKILLTKKD